LINFSNKLFRYEVFKLQSENDAYMIASGIPLATAAKLGDSHASEMATMALDIMSGASYFVIPNKPKEKLRLRIGIHSGPAVGGVQKAGDDMPRLNFDFILVSKVVALNLTISRKCPRYPTIITVFPFIAGIDYLDTL
jgi:class 3 adenylate cyclase